MSYICGILCLLAESVAFVVRSLCSLKVSDNYLGWNFAETVLNTLRDASSGLSILDLSENNVRYALQLNLGFYFIFEQLYKTNLCTQLTIADNRLAF